MCARDAQARVTRRRAQARRARARRAKAPTRVPARDASTSASVWSKFFVPGVEAHSVGAWRI